MKYQLDPGGVRTILSIRRWQVVAGRRIEGRRVADAEGNTAAAASAVVGPSHWGQVLVCGAAVGRRLRRRTVAGVAGWDLVRGDRCNETKTWSR